MDLLYFAGLAFLGGLILNVMPCVLPVLTLKVFHLLEHSENDSATNRMHGLAYTAGVVLTFLALAGVLIGLKAAGHAVFYGKQFQSTSFLAVMVAVLLAFSLNCFGVFEITVGVSGGPGRDGYRGSFINGILATILSTPCSAPLFGTAVAYALLAAPPHEALLLFAASGLGLAAPFLLLTHVPSLRRFLPKPGAWMDTFKQLLGFTLLGTAVWLGGILFGKLSPASGSRMLWALFGLGLLLWVVGRYGNLMQSLARRVGTRVLLVVGIVAMGMWVKLESVESRVAEAPSATVDHEHPVVKDGKINWLAYDEPRIARERARQRPVFVDFTADWCISCKANEKAVIETEATRALLVDSQILPMKADMTDDQPVLEREMKRLGRSAIPIYVIYLPDGSYKLLPEVLTPELLHSALKDAAARFPKSSYLAPGPA